MDPQCKMAVRRGMSRCRNRARIWLRLAFTDGSTYDTQYCGLHDRGATLPKGYGPSFSKSGEGACIAVTVLHQQRRPYAKPAT